MIQTMSLQLSTGFIAAHNSGHWEIIRKHLHDFAPTEVRTNLDFNCAMYMCAGNKLICTNKKWWTPEIVSFALYDLQNGFINAMQANNKQLFIWLTYCLPVVNLLDEHSLMRTICNASRYQSTMKMFRCYYNSLKNSKHWVHYSYICLVLITQIINRVKHMSEGTEYMCLATFMECMSSPYF